MTSIALIAAERIRQKHVLGHDEEADARQHDDPRALGDAGAGLVLFGQHPAPETTGRSPAKGTIDSLKSKGRLQDLVRGAALITAEIDQILIREGQAGPADAIFSLDEFQVAASGTAIYPGHDDPSPVASDGCFSRKDERRLTYLLCGMAGESGEALNQVKKLMRNSERADEIEISSRIGAIRSEARDVLWYVSETLRACGEPLSESATELMRKLRDRQGAGKIHGDGERR